MTRKPELAEPTFEFDGGGGWLYSLHCAWSGEARTMISIGSVSGNMTGGCRFSVSGGFPLSYTLRLFGNGSVSTGTIGSPSFVKSCEIEIYCATNWTLLLAPGRMMVS